ncbi:MAG: hypothetical protein IJS71_08450 [Clostridia bacterium]|nr:hypothetical protein [Clostridia bacterium]
MTREEAIKKLERRLSNMKFVDDVYVDCVDGEALEMAVKALKREQQLLDAGYQNTTVDFYIGGRLFRAKEIAQ